MAAGDPSSLIKSLNKQVLSQFLHECIDDLIERKKATFDNISNDIEWRKENYDAARKFIQTIYRNSIILPEIPMSSSLNDFSEEYQLIIAECFEIRKPEIVGSLINQSIKQSDTSVVTDYDWKLKWVMGGSSLASVREPLLQMDLHCTQLKEKNSTINFEMNLKELDEFIDVLEKMKTERNEKN